MFLSTVQLFALSTLVLTAGAPPSDQLQAERRSFNSAKCLGRFDAAKVARLDRLCDDCSNFVGNIEIFPLCETNCFTTAYFKGCADLLHESDQLQLFSSYILYLHGADPTVLLGTKSTTGTVAAVGTEGTVSTAGTSTVSRDRLGATTPYSTSYRPRVGYLSPDLQAY